MKLSFLIIAAFLLNTCAEAVRPASSSLESAMAWLRVYTARQSRPYYLEIAKDGSFICRTEIKNSVYTRRGTINPRLAKDLFQEIENSENLTSQEKEKGRLLFYKGEIVQLSANLKGELKTVTATLESFGQGFNHALSAIKNEVAKSKPVTWPDRFIAVEPLSKEELSDLTKTSEASKRSALPMIETVEIMKVKPLAKAIEKPYRLVPVEKDDTGKLHKFITAYNLKGYRNLFYFSSTRGDFRCVILDSWR